MKLQSIIESMTIQQAEQLLGTKANSSPNDIKKAWRQASAKNHPDLGGSTARMAQLNAAKDFLSNPIFVTQSHQQPPQQPPPPPPQQAPPSGNAYGPYGAYWAQQAQYYPPFHASMVNAKQPDNVSDNDWAHYLRLYEIWYETNARPMHGKTSIPPPLPPGPTPDFARS